MRYLGITKITFMTQLSRRFDFIFTYIGNTTYIVLVYFLWRSIYKSQTSINGVTFNQVFLYLALASSIFCMFQIYTEWYMSIRMISGDIISDFIKPLDFQFMMLFHAIGGVLANFITILIPSVLVIILFFGSTMTIGLNVIFFLISLFFALFIIFNIDYMIGLTSFYTESIWGIGMTKEVCVLFLSGAMVPLSFFPEGFRNVLALLPFQAIYDTPLTILITPGLNLKNYIAKIGVQILWSIILLILSRLFHMKAIKVITVNGG